MLRPVAVAALRGGVPEKFQAPGVILRQVLTWVLSTGVPLVAILLALVASKFEILTAPADRVITTILLLAIVAFGSIGVAGVGGGAFGRERLERRQPATGGAGVGAEGGLVREGQTWVRAFLS